MIIAKNSNHHLVRILQGIPIGIADDVDYCYALLVKVSKFQKQMFLFSFEQKIGRNSFEFCPSL